MDKPKKYEDRLMEAFDFDDDDLAANQAGTLTRRQANRLKQGRTSLALGGASILLMGFLVMMVVLGAVNLAALVPSVAAILLGIGAFFLGLCLLVWRRSQRIIADLRENRVAEAEGRVDLSVASGQYGSSYTIRVGDLKFPVKQPVFLAFKNGDPYRIFYAPHSKRILSVEWLRENDDNLLENTDASSEKFLKPEQVEDAKEPTRAKRG